MFEFSFRKATRTNSEPPAGSPEDPYKINWPCRRLQRVSRAADGSRQCCWLSAIASGQGIESKVMWPACFLNGYVVLREMPIMSRLWKVAQGLTALMLATISLASSGGMSKSPSEVVGSANLCKGYAKSTRCASSSTWNYWFNRCASNYATFVTTETNSSAKVDGNTIICTGATNCQASTHNKYTTNCTPNNG